LAQTIHLAGYRIGERKSYYRGLLLRELEARRSKNPRYSLRAFSRFLDIDSAALCRVLSGKQELSPRSGARLVGKLRLSQSEKRLFVRSILQDRKHRDYLRLSKAMGEELADPLGPLRVERRGDGAWEATLALRLAPESEPILDPLIRQCLEELVDAITGGDADPEMLLRIAVSKPGI
jgi:hypothetical protein